MTQSAIVPAFPEPYLQPDRMKDCGYYAAAYVARCLGRPDVTAEQIKAWRERTSRHETYFARCALGADMLTMWDFLHGESPMPDFVPLPSKIFWLGQTELARQWVRHMLADGWIAQALVHRIQPMGHAVVLLGASDDGVLLMDPIYGHVTEPWSWLLGPGPKAEAAEWPGRAEDGREFYGCTFIEGWYKPGEPLNDRESDR